MFTPDCRRNVEARSKARVAAAAINKAAINK
jgi:hypothetical protein